MADEFLASLRSLMASHSPPLDALVVPSEDYHQVSFIILPTRLHVYGFIVIDACVAVSVVQFNLAFDVHYCSISSLFGQY